MDGRDRTSGTAGRAERLAAALRENLRKRKAQSRVRAAPVEEPDPDLNASEAGPADGGQNAKGGEDR